MIYFIQGTITKNIKIGFTDKDDIIERLRDLNSSDPLICLKLILDEGKAMERYLHVQFKHLSSHGEWFKPGQDLLDFIEKIPKTKESGMIHLPKLSWEKVYPEEPYASRIERPTARTEGCVKFYPFTEKDGQHWNTILIFKCPHCNHRHKNVERGTGKEPAFFLTNCTNVRGQIEVYKYGKLAVKPS